MGVFCQNLGITAYTLENYSNYKSNISFNNGSILEIHDYFRTGGNASLNNLSQIINTLSNQDFAGLDKFRLGESQGKISVQLLKINKNNRNECSMSDFLSSPFSPAMPMGNTSLAAGENTSLTLDKRESLLKIKFLKASSEKFLLYRRLFLY